MRGYCLAKPGAWSDNPWEHGRSGWNTLSFAGAIPDEELLEAVDDSYRMVVGKLPKKLRPEGWDAQ